MDNYASVFEDDFRAFGEERLIKYANPHNSKGGGVCVRVCV